MHAVTLDQVASKLLLTYGYLLPYIAILGALAAGIYVAYKAWNKEA